MKNRMKRLTALFLITSVCSGMVVTDVRNHTLIFAEEAVPEETSDLSESEKGSSEDEPSAVSEEGTPEGEPGSESGESTEEGTPEGEPGSESGESTGEGTPEGDPGSESEGSTGEGTPEGEPGSESGESTGEGTPEGEPGSESGGSTGEGTPEGEPGSENGGSTGEETPEGEPGSESGESTGEGTPEGEPGNGNGESAGEGTPENESGTSEEESNETDEGDGTKEETAEELETEEEVVEIPKELVVITDPYGEQLPTEAIEVPQQLTVEGQTYPVDYAQGVYRVYVPEGTDSVVITVPDQREEESLSILKWNGYVIEQEQIWSLYPDASWAGDYKAEGNTYTVALEQYAIDKESITEEQYAVYGELEDDIDYAEIFVYGEERAELLLVEYVPDFTQVSVLSASKTEVKDAYSSTGKNLAQSAEKYIPTVSSINGEWQILGLARSDANVKSNVYDEYVNNLLKILKENDGVLHKKKYTEYSRVILALTSLGYDVTNVGGYNLLKPLSDYDQTVWQGINGAAFALIAFDSHDYEIPKAEEGKTQNSREKLIDTMLGKELSGGGWALSGKKADPDMTAMVMQSLAPYYNSNAKVKSAIDRGLAKLSSMQMEDGSYATYGTKTSESCSQVVVALSALGINPNTDSRFTKNGISVLEALLAFQMPDGSFRHVMNGGSDQMATEQAYYALTAYERFSNGKTSLYNMNDVVLPSDEKKAAEVKKLIKALPDAVKLSHKTKIENAWNAYNALTETQKGLITKEELKKLQTAVEALKKLDDSWKEEEPDKTPESGKDDAEKPGTGGKDDAEKPGAGGKDDTEKPGTGEKDDTEKPGAGGKDDTEKPGTGGKDDTEKPGTGEDGEKDDTEKPGTGEDGEKDDTEKPGTGEDDEKGDTEKPDTDKGSDKVAGGTTKQVDLVSGSTTRKETVVKVPKDQTEEEEAEETEEKTVKKKTAKKDAEVKKLLKKIKALFGTTKSKNKLPDEVKDYTEEQIDAILEIYCDYMEFSAKQKAELEKETYYKKYQEVLEKLRTAHHYDAASGTDLSDNEDDMLPWYIKMEVSQMAVEQEEAAAVKEALNGQGELLALSDISLENLLEGESWQPEELLRVSIPLVDLKDYEKAAIVHLRDDGSMEFLTAYIAGTKLEFDADHFSSFGVVGYNGSMAELMQEPQEENEWIYLAPGAGAALLLLLILIKRAAGTKKKKDVKHSEG